MFPHTKICGLHEPARRQTFDFLAAFGAFCVRTRARGGALVAAGWRIFFLCFWASYGVFAAGTRPQRARCLVDCASTIEVSDDWSHEETDNRLHADRRTTSTRIDGCARVPYQFGLRSGSI